MKFQYYKEFLINGLVVGLKGKYIDSLFNVKTIYLPNLSKIYENNIIFINNQNSLLYSLKNSNANENFIGIISKVDFSNSEELVNFNYFINMMKDENMKGFSVLM